MSNFNKTLQALSVIQSELDVLKYELSPSGWAVLCHCLILNFAVVLAPSPVDRACTHSRLW
jgi:hypothetical protein